MLVMACESTGRTRTSLSERYPTAQNIPHCMTEFSAPRGERRALMGVDHLAL
jgi:hypothetical protein